MVQQRLFITASGTEVGKTYIAELLIRQIRARGIACAALKPIITGFEITEENDTVRLLNAQNIAVSEKTIAACSPWRYALPLSPDMAAAHAGKQIDFNQLVAFSSSDSINLSATDKRSQPQIVLIEGIGGVLVPLNDRHLVADWIRAVDCPACLVTGSYLGTISHTLTAYEALQRRNIDVSAIVISESADQPVPPQDTAATLARFVDPTKIVIVSRSAAKPAPDLLGPLLDLS